MAKRRLSIAEILRWVDGFHERRGRYPKADDGDMIEADMTWHALDLTLRRGYRGLRGKSSLAELLRIHRGVRNIHKLPKLKRERILQWADAHFRKSGEWPLHTDGIIPKTNGETWNAIDSALRTGSRGLRGRSSLAQLLSVRRAVRNPMGLPPLTNERILAWADRHFEQTGEWPTQYSGEVFGEARESWQSLNASLLQGHRGLPGGSSIARLLSEYRGVRNHMDVPDLTEEQILGWADAYHAQTGKWPTRTSGVISGTSGETWGAVESALLKGRRGLKAQGTLANLFDRTNRKPMGRARPLLTLKQIRGWMQAFYERTGMWPHDRSGAIPESLGETWRSVARALALGKRGLPQGLTIIQLRKVGKQSI